MTLAALIRKRESGKPANANPANPANDGQGNAGTLATLATLALANLPKADAELFEFNPPGDPANDDEALQERVAIMMEGNGWDEAKALREARWQVDKERCWRGFLRNAERVLAAPQAHREGLLALYQQEAASRYGQGAASVLTESLRNWITARKVH